MRNGLLGSTEHVLKQQQVAPQKGIFGIERRQIAQPATGVGGHPRPGLRLWRPSGDLRGRRGRLASGRRLSSRSLGECAHRPARRRLYDDSGLALGLWGRHIRQPERPDADHVAVGQRVHLVGRQRQIVERRAVAAAHILHAVRQTVAVEAGVIARHGAMGQHQVVLRRGVAADAHHWLVEAIDQVRSIGRVDDQAGACRLSHGSLSRLDGDAVNVRYDHLVRQQVDFAVSNVRLIGLIEPGHLQRLHIEQPVYALDARVQV